MENNPQIINTGFLTSILGMKMRPGEVYNLVECGVFLSGDFKDSFSNVCQVLKTSTSPKSLVIEFSVDASELRLLGDVMAHNRSIEEIRLSILDEIDHEAFDSFTNSIRLNNRPLKKLELQIEPEDLEEILDSIKGLNVPAKNFKLEILSLVDNDGLYRQLIEVLQTTNVNHIDCVDGIFFEDELPVASDGQFLKFIDHVIKHDQLKSFQFSKIAGDEALPYLANLVTKTTNLRCIKIKITSETPTRLQELLDALAKSNIRKLLFSGPAEKSPEPWLNIAKALRSMRKLTKLDFLSDVPYLENFMTILSESESIRQCRLIIRGAREYPAFAYRNIQQQNERVRDLIVVLFNIARQISSLPLPRDIWHIVMSSVTIPGVSLDFGAISNAIFKNTSIRRVIYKQKKC